MSEKLLAVFLFVLSGLIALIIMVAEPIPALAQGPPEGCTSWNLYYDFEDGTSSPWGLLKLSLKNASAPGAPPSMLDDYWISGGSDYNKSEATMTRQNIHDIFGTDIATTTYYVEYIEYKAKKSVAGTTFRALVEFVDDDISQEIFTATLANTLYTFSFTNTTYKEARQILVGTNQNGKYQSFDEIYISGCATGFPEEAGASGQYCALVPDADFESDPTEWSLYNSASITSSLLSLAGVDYAEQVVSSVISNTDYTVALTATGTTTGTDILQVEIVGTGDLITRTFTLTTTAAPYSATFTTGISVTTPTLRLLMASGSGDIDFVCITADDYFTGEEGACLTTIIDGGEFATADDAAKWIFVNGAAHNEVAQNAWLPYIMSGTVENLGTSAVGRVTLADTPPELNTGEYLILQFDARSLVDDGAIIARYLNDALTDTVAITYTFSTSTDYQTYQTDFSSFAGDTSNIEVGFFNGSYVVTETAGVFLDNVCLFVSSSPITNPQTSGGFLTVDLPNCNTVSGWLSDTIGIDFESLETMAEPSIWDADEWVPWLASRLWVYAIKPLICFLLILVNLFGLAYLNWIWWFVRQPDIIFAWLGGWIGYFIGDLSAWLLWFSSPLASTLSFLYAILSDWQTTLSYIGAIVSWLWEILQALVFWLLGYWLDQFTTIINALLFAWNLLLPSIGSVIGEIIDLLIAIWNDSLAPWLADLGAVGQFILFLISQIGLLGDLIIFFFQTVWYFSVMIWGFITGAADLPITFYQAFNDSVNDDAYVLLSCAGDVTDQWCLALAGLVIVDEAISHSFLYPLVIIGIIVATIVIFWRHIWELISFRIR